MRVAGRAPQHSSQITAPRHVACRVLTESAKLDIGSDAPTFELPEPLTGKTVKISDFKGKALLVTFICNHCP